MTLEGAPIDLDLLSIDVDGNDWQIWKAIEVYRPRVVLIEFNPSIPNEVYFVQSADTSVNQGNSLRAMIELGRTKGYSLVCVAGMDAYFVLDELYSAFNIPDNDIDNMFCAAQTVLWQGYDGTIFTAGVQTLA